MRRFPLAPLLEVTGLTMAQLNARIRMGGDTYRRVQTEGLSELVADRWATRLGLHPAEVWTDWFDPLTRVCAAEDCTETFRLHLDGPGGHNRRWCSEACRRRVGMRAYRQTPEGREANRRYLAEYRAWRKRREAA